MMKKLLYILILLLVGTQGKAQETVWTSVKQPLKEVKALKKQIVKPKFRNKDYVITDFGAVGDGTTKNTKAIADAIAKCHAEGGGRVVVPEGVFLTGAIHLKSNVNLHLVDSTVVLFSRDSSDYPMVFTRWEGMECVNYSPLIYAYEQENIAITGNGTLDGNANTRPRSPT
jgi:polygalacturonase